MTLITQRVQKEASAPVCSSNFRKIMGHFPTGVTVVTVDHRESCCLGVTINSLTSVSLAPPLVLFCMKKKAIAHDLVVNSQSFAISILAHNQQELALECAEPGGAKLADPLLVHSYDGNFLVRGAIASIECTQEEIYPGGDHTIIVGLVTRLYSELDNQPLVFHRSRFTEVLQGTR